MPLGISLFQACTYIITFCVLDSNEGLLNDYPGVDAGVEPHSIREEPNEYEVRGYFAQDCLLYSDLRLLVQLDTVT